MVKGIVTHYKDPNGTIFPRVITQYIKKGYPELSSCGVPKMPDPNSDEGITLESLFFNKPYPLYNAYAISKARQETVIIAEDEIEADSFDDRLKAIGERKYVLTCWPGKEYTVDGVGWVPLDNLKVLYSLKRDQGKDCALAYKVYEAVRNDCRSATFDFIVPISLSESLRGSLTDGPLPETKILGVKDFMKAVYRTHGIRLGNAPEPSQDLVSYTCQELCHSDIGEPCPDILTDFLPQPGIIFLYGPSGCGKTWLVLQLAKIIATGASDGFGGRIVAPDKSTVLYVDGEMIRNKAKQRLDLLDMADLDNVHFIFGVPDRPSGMKYDNPASIPDLTTSEGQKAVETIANRLSVNGRLVIVIDNLASLAPAAIKNDSSCWEPMISWLKSLKSQGVSVIVVHHSGKKGDQLGSSAKEFNVDTSIHLERATDPRPGTIGMNVEFTKTRYFQGTRDPSFRATLIFPNDGSKAYWESTERFSAKDADANQGKRIGDNLDVERALKLASEGRTSTDAAKEFGLSRSTFERRMNEQGQYDEFQLRSKEARSKPKPASSASKMASEPAMTKNESEDMGVPSPAATKDSTQRPMASEGFQGDDL
jgi:putative DNA primase/helicase